MWGVYLYRSLNPAEIAREKERSNLLSFPGQRENVAKTNLPSLPRHSAAKLCRHKAPLRLYDQQPHFFFFFSQITFSNHSRNSRQCHFLRYALSWNTLELEYDSFWRVNGGAHRSCATHFGDRWLAFIWTFHRGPFRGMLPLETWYLIGNETILRFKFVWDVLSLSGG